MSRRDEEIQNIVSRLEGMITDAEAAVGALGAILRGEIPAAEVTGGAGGEQE